MKKKQLLLVLGGLLFLYAILHFWGLTRLPVFADEAIYIRWAQLIIDDWQQYLFFPLNDGKTPLFMWLMLPFQFIFSDQLYAGRFVSVVIGAAQVVVIFALLRKLTKRVETVIFGSSLVVLLPFWYFHHRMALTEGLLVLFLSIAVYGVVLLEGAPISKKNWGFSKAEWQAIIVGALGFGAALLTKIPAILFIPSFFLLLFLIPKKKSTLRKKMLGMAVMIAGGVALLFSLGIHPAFSQLFNRGGDFLYPVSEVLAGRWFDNALRIPGYAYYFLTYMSWPVFALIGYGLFSKKVQRQVHIFFWSGVLFCLPIFIMGKVVHPRYFFPAVLFFTVSAAFGFEGLLYYLESSKLRFLARFSVTLLAAIMMANIVTYSFGFIVSSVRNADTTPFVSADRYQYLEAWSSGHGILPLVGEINQAAEKGTIAVATEGSFGTLPDGILLYLHRRNVDDIYIEGVSFPSEVFPTKFVARAKQFETVWYVANEDRVSIDTTQFPEVHRYCRPFDAPCLVVWDITDAL